MRITYIYYNFKVRYSLPNTLFIVELLYFYYTLRRFKSQVYLIYIFT
nr:MAG TPA: hypothetical protein [Caudoviricetes sp.]